MQVLICPDSFKGTLTSSEVASAMARGVESVCPDTAVEIIPMGDGGEGTVEALCRGLGREANIERVECETVDPLGRGIKASYAILHSDRDVALIEVASASGLTLLKPEERDVLKATSAGTGFLIRDAYIKGCREFIIGLGGSATCDCGKGIYEVLKDLHLEKDYPKTGILLPDCHFNVLSDVTNPLCGVNGAAAVFGPQKGAAEADIEVLERRNLECAAEYVRNHGRKVADMPFSGVAGGIGTMFMACLDSTMEKGIEAVMRMTGFDEKLDGSDVVITGEGCLDATTFRGKVIDGILRKIKGRKEMVVGIVAGRVKSAVDEENKRVYIEEATPKDIDVEAETHHDWSLFVEEATVRLMKKFKDREVLKENGLNNE